MFTGIIEETGLVEQVKSSGTSGLLSIKAKKVMEDLKNGDSIAVNGICLTVTSLYQNSFCADVMHETLRRSSLADIRPGRAVNLERAMAAGGRFGGHIVTGHIDGTGIVERTRQDGIAVWFFIRTEPGLIRYLVEKGSVAVDGISLTVAGVWKTSFAVSVIPHTLAETTLMQRRPGDRVNLENDCIGKYVERLLGPSTAQIGGVTDELLMKCGF